MGISYSVSGVTWPRPRAARRQRVRSRGLFPWSKMKERKRYRRGFGRASLGGGSRIVIPFLLNWGSQSVWCGVLCAPTPIPPDRTLVYPEGRPLKSSMVGENSRLMETYPLPLPTQRSKPLTELDSARRITVGIYRLLPNPLRARPYATTVQVVLKRILVSSQVVRLATPMLGSQVLC